MAGSKLTRLLRNPFGLMLRAVRKKIIGPLKYGKGAGYDVERYWRDRFSKHGLSLRGAGNEGLSENQNRQLYEEAGRTFTDLCRAEGVELAKASVLEIGVGTGFYTGLLRQAGVKQYLGLDITDLLFDKLRGQVPGFRFAKKDITAETPEGKFDLVVMMDVVEHIVEETHLEAAMANVRQSLAPGGVFVISGVHDRSKRTLFYVRCWSAEEIARHFPDWVVTGPIPFRDNNVLVFRRP